MAEALWNQLGHDHWQAFSAGSHPVGYVHPLAIEAMHELGLNPSEFRSKHVDEFRDDRFDLVITVCDSAKESCPVFPTAKQLLHWPFAGPAHAIGTPEEKIAAFRRVRDPI